MGTSKWRIQVTRVSAVVRGRRNGPTRPIAGPAAAHAHHAGFQPEACPAGRAAGASASIRSSTSRCSLDLKFKDEAGREVPLSAYFSKGKPVILALVYYRCPMLCTQILNGLAGSLKAVSLDPGKDFEIVAVSFDPKDTPETAAAKKQMYLRRYGRPNTANGWHLLTGDQANIKALTDTVGYHYKYDAATDQFAHASGIMVLTPEGRLSRYFYGVEYPAARCAARAGGGVAKQDRFAGRSDSVVLLPLRPGHRKVRGGCHEPGAPRRRIVHADLRRVSLHLSAPRRSQ